MIQKKKPLVYLPTSNSTAAAGVCMYVCVRRGRCTIAVALPINKSQVNIPFAFLWCRDLFNLYFLCLICLFWPKMRRYFISFFYFPCFPFLFIMFVLVIFASLFGWSLWFPHAASVANCCLANINFPPAFLLFTVYAFLLYLYICVFVYLCVAFALLLIYSPKLSAARCGKIYLLSHGKISRFLRV